MKQSATPPIHAPAEGSTALPDEKLDRQIRELIYVSCLCLDEKKFDEFLDLCADDFAYTITAYSPEARTEMTWMDETKPSLRKMLDVLPRHNSDHSPLTRHATVYTLHLADDGAHADVVTAFQIFRTGLDGGGTQLLAVGRYYDRVRCAGGERPTLVSRNVRLDTRELGLGSHIPF